MSQKNRAVISGLSDTLVIKKQTIPNTSVTQWVLHDTIADQKIAITADEVPELVAMLEAFRSRCIENRDSTLTPVDLIDTSPTIHTTAKELTD